MNTIFVKKIFINKPTTNKQFMVKTIEIVTLSIDFGINRIVK